MKLLVTPVAFVLALVLCGCPDKPKPQWDDFQVFLPPNFEFSLCEEPGVADDGLPYNAVVVDGDLSAVDFIEALFTVSGGQSFNVSIDPSAGYANVDVPGPGTVEVLLHLSNSDVFSYGPFDFSVGYYPCGEPDDGGDGDDGDGDGDGGDGDGDDDGGDGDDDGGDGDGDDDGGDGDPTPLEFEAVLPPLSDDGVTVQFTSCSDANGNSPQHPDDPSRPWNSVGVDLDGAAVLGVAVDFTPDNGALFSVVIDPSSGRTALDPGGSGFLVIRVIALDGTEYASEAIPYVSSCDDGDGDDNGDGDDGDGDGGDGDGDGDGDGGDGEPGDFPFMLVLPPLAEGVVEFTDCTVTGGNSPSHPDDPSRDWNAVGIVTDESVVELWAEFFPANGSSYTLPIDPSSGRRGYNPGGSGTLVLHVVTTTGSFVSDPLPYMTGDRCQ